MSKAEDVAKAEAEFKAAATALQAANAEKDSPAPAAKAPEVVEDVQVSSETEEAAEAPAAPDVVLDKNRAYGTIGGDYFVGETRVRYQQDGLNFDHLGNLVKE